MDGLAFHPYADSSGQSPDTPHPSSTTIGLADYDRLIRTLGTAFDGTAQAGSSLPVLYDEFGVESRIPAGKATALHGRGAGDDEAGGRDHAGRSTTRRALQLAFCQPNVTGILLFHSQDEPALASWQSGVYYADGTPKSSLYAVRDALARARGGSIARCDGLGLDVAATEVCTSRPRRSSARGSRVVRFTCIARLRLGGAGVAARRTGATRARLTGYGRAGVAIARLAQGAQARHRAITFSLTLTPPGQPRRSRRCARAPRSASA